MTHASAEHHKVPPGLADSGITGGQGPAGTALGPVHRRTMGYVHKARSCAALEVFCVTPTSGGGKQKWTPS